MQLVSYKTKISALKNCNILLFVYLYLPELLPSKVGQNGESAMQRLKYQIDAQ
jgi:hypothetical protein